MNKQALYLKQTDAFILAIDNNSKSKVEKFQQREILITIVSIIIVSIEVIFIFIPTIEKIKKQNEQFRTIAFNQSHVIRRPLVNIKGLLILLIAQKWMKILGVCRVLQNRRLKNWIPL